MYFDHMLHRLFSQIRIIRFNHFTLPDTFFFFFASAFYLLFVARVQHHSFGVFPRHVAFDEEKGHGAWQWICVPFFYRFMTNLVLSLSTWVVPSPFPSSPSPAKQSQDTSYLYHTYCSRSSSSSARKHHTYIQRASQQTVWTFVPDRKCRLLTAELESRSCQYSF